MHQPARWSVLFLVLTVPAGTDPVLAQQGLTPNRRHLSRQLRSLYQARTSPGANLTPQVQRARRDLVQRSGGVAFTPEQARIDRGLTQLGRQAAAGAVVGNRGSGGRPARPAIAVAIATINHYPAFTAQRLLAG